MYDQIRDPNVSIPNEGGDNKKGGEAGVVRGGG